MALTPYYHYALYTIIVLGVLTIIATVFNQGGYGKLLGNTKGLMSDRLAWVLFEAPQWFAFALTYWLILPAFDGSITHHLTGLVLFAIWQLHYTYRGFVYPWRRRGQGGKGFPIVAVVIGFLFNSLNGFTNAYAITYEPHLQLDSWLTSPLFIGGAIIAVIGWLINFQADNILLNLRADGSSGYKIPHGGAFRYVSSANYFGEITWWVGWSIMVYNIAGWVFIFFVLANLVPRAIQNHRWYKQQFPDYPKDRKAIVPFVL